MPLTEPTVQLRRIPYPYRAMLAICSDLDETPDRTVYLNTMRFLNTTQLTTMGEGLGLEVGNTIYFDMPSDQFAYWNTDETGRAMVRMLIRSGHIDCLHSFGDLATTRARAASALEDLCRHDCRLEVWIDHATAATNFGADIMRGHGDEPGHEAYHADLTTEYGIRYVWRGRVTSVIGQDVRPHLEALLHPRYPLASARTAAKEAAKHVLGRWGHERYAMNGTNRVLRRTRLRDGREVYEFLRSNPHFAGLDAGETARGIGEVLSERMLQHLADRGGVCVLYTHLGKVHSYEQPFGIEAVAGLRRLAGAQRNGQILVTTTRRLLRYCRAMETVPFEVRQEGGGLRIEIGNPGPDLCLDGLTFHVPAELPVRVTIDGEEAAGVQHNPRDATDRPSVSLPWPQLEWPEP
jgi:hypothetical protein